MANTISPLQVYQGKSWAGLTTDNHLGTIFQEHPYLASSIMARVFAKYDHMNLDALLTLFGAEEEHPSDVDFEWWLKGDDTKAIKVVSYSASSTSQPGINNSTFRIVFSRYDCQI